MHNSSSWVRTAGQIQSELVALHRRLEARQQAVNDLRSQWDAVPKTERTPADLKQKIKKEFVLTRDVLFEVRDTGPSHARLDRMPSMFYGKAHDEMVAVLEVTIALERSGGELFQGEKAKDADRQLTSLQAKLDANEKEVTSLLREMRTIPEGERLSKELRNKLEDTALRGQLSGIEANITRLEVQSAIESLSDGPVRQDLVKRFETAVSRFKRVADGHAQIREELARHAKQAPRA